MYVCSVFGIGNSFYSVISRSFSNYIGVVCRTIDRHTCLIKSHHISETYKHLVRYQTCKVHCILIQIVPLASVEKQPRIHTCVDASFVSRFHVQF